MSKEKTVFCSGVFDVVHRGHVELLEKASKLGRVVVGLNNDESVRALKGLTRPVNDELDRLYVIERFACVAYGFLIPSTKVTGAILQLRPDFWVKGGSYTLETLDKEEVAAAREVGAEIVIVPMKPGYSTTETIRRLEGK